MTAKTPATAKAKKGYVITKTGRKILVNQTLAALKTVRPTYSSFLLGMIHWPVLGRNQALEALQVRSKAVAKELERLADIQFDQQPLQDFVDAVFDFSVGQLKAEAEWLAATLEYMQTKLWNS